MIGIHQARGLCSPCHARHRRAGTLSDYERSTRTRDDLLEDYVVLRSQGYSWRDCAARLAMTYSAFARAMQRARIELDPRAGRPGEVWPR